MDIDNIHSAYHITDYHLLHVSIVPRSVTFYVNDCVSMITLV